MTSTELLSESVKYCRACEADHPVSLFSRNSSNADGLEAKCRRSRNAARKVTRQARKAESMDRTAHAIATGWFPPPFEPRAPQWPELVDEASPAMKEFNRRRVPRPCVSSPEMFFSDVPEHVDAARTACSKCPVAWECLILALTRNEEFGVWGGMSSEERQGFKEAIEP